MYSFFRRRPAPNVRYTIDASVWTVWCVRTDKLGSAQNSCTKFGHLKIDSTFFFWSMLKYLHLAPHTQIFIEIVQKLPQNLDVNKKLWQKILAQICTENCSWVMKNVVKVLDTFGHLIFFVFSMWKGCIMEAMHLYQLKMSYRWHFFLKTACDWGQHQF